MNIWHALESLPGQIALPIEWRALLDCQFTTFQTAFLKPSGDEARTFPCPTQPGALHPIELQPNGSLLAPCPIYPQTCHLPLVKDDIRMWQLNTPRLGRALCVALGLDSKLVELPLFNTRQIASCPADAAPVILTFQSDSCQFDYIVSGLAAYLHGPFLLLCPTAQLLTATSKRLRASRLGLPRH